MMLSNCQSNFSQRTWRLCALLVSVKGTSYWNNYFRQDVTLNSRSCSKKLRVTVTRYYPALTTTTSRIRHLPPASDFVLKQRTPTVIG